ncbi:MAG: endolytic transglycosylase MltG [Arcanobacterium sp.]
MSEIFDELSETQRAAHTKAHSRAAYHRRKHIRTSIVLFFTAVLVVVSATVAFPFVKQVFTGENRMDYPGPGTVEVMVVILEGATGSVMAEILYEANVVASEKAFIDAFNADPRSASIQPGTYRLREEMSGQGAVSALLDPASRAEITITIPEGFTKYQVADRIASILGVDRTEVEAAMADAEGIGLPEEAYGEIEGWIAPLTYTFEPDVTPTDILATMVSHRVAELESIGLPREDWYRTLTVASIVEREVNWPDYYGQVARVIENRLVDDSQVNGLLQMDSTTLYGVGKSGGIPSADDLANDNPYNTYMYTGLPPTPISNPAISVIEACIDPPEGDWLFFVTVNLETGETLFATTLEEHNQNVALLSAWYSEHGQSAEESTEEE